MELPAAKGLIAKLQKILDGPNAKKRESAIARLAELGRAGNKEAVAVLSRALFDEWNFDYPEMRISIVRALSRINSPESAKALISAAESAGGKRAKDISLAAANALGGMKGTHMITDALFRIINAKSGAFPVHDDELRAEAARSIGRILSQAPGEYPRMVRLLGRVALSRVESMEVKLAAIEALGNSGSSSAIKPLYSLLSGQRPLSRRQEAANPYNRQALYASAAEALQNLSRIGAHGNAAKRALSRATQRNEGAREAVLAIMQPSRPTGEPTIAKLVPSRQPPEAHRRRKVTA
ncbi:MAG: HEAT repeat domain-containing protein [Candidatus Bilamarchaeaceae archaeon]